MFHSPFKISISEFHHPYYSLRRIWRAQSLVAPSLNLSPWAEGALTRAYPFAVTPDKKLSVSDLFTIHRDNYEGTEFDLTKGLAAGPFSDPNWFEGQAESVVDKEGKQQKVPVSFQDQLQEYYALRGWDKKGLPTHEKLLELQLN